MGQGAHRGAPCFVSSSRFRHLRRAEFRCRLTMNENKPEGVPLLACQMDKVIWM
jgi:hypothetical protein